MSLEIEKKFVVPDFNSTLDKLKNDYGECEQIKKEGFWLCNNYNTLDKIFTVKEPKISKKEVAIIRSIGEFHLPDDEYHYVRIRINNKNKKVITFKNKSLVNNVEQNIEYEFEVNEEKFKNIVSYLKEKANIFYYNIKDSWLFEKNDFKIELSKLNDLKDSYIEIETVGKDETILHSKLNKFLVLFTDYKLKEESRNYVELFFIENYDKLKAQTLGQYSREGFRVLEKYSI